MKRCAWTKLITISAVALGMALVSGCRQAAPTSWQGYFEGDFIYVASPLAGRLDHLLVRKGARVEAGAPLFTLESTAEVAAQREAAARLRQSQARFEDLKKGQRPTELAELESRLGQSRAVGELSAGEFRRVTQLHQTGAVSDDDFDRARFNHEANTNRIAELQALVATARLGGRSDAIAAAEADLAAAGAAKERADWSVAQKTQASACSALVYDTLYREGEFVPSGTPVVSLLPPTNIKARFFVSESELSTLKAGDIVKVTITGRAEPVDARVNYLSPRPEFTPPVLYNRDNRAKLVFMIEAIPVDPAAARDLHPGQPIDVRR